ncbi:MAG: hypothetical protein KGL39_43085 [Patescibacteria group bacterium]|nr:hypothetical protein [Patescibacteria group bacterium]
MTREDFLREQRLQIYGFDLSPTKSKDEIRQMWERMLAEIKTLQPERAAEMERERGLGR